MSTETDYDYEDFSESETCLRCGGSGEENICWDDLCAGMDECIHGDGIIPCRACSGSGVER